MKRRKNTKNGLNSFAKNTDFNPQGIKESIMDLKLTLELHLKWLKNEDGGSRANLSRADLSGANLSGAKLFSANLSGAILSEAYLSGANLSFANLSEANFSRANEFAYGANLSEADLSWANLENIKWDEQTSWPDLSSFKGARNIPEALKKQLGL